MVGRITGVAGGKGLNLCGFHSILVSLKTGWQKVEDDKTLVCNKCDRANTCMFCRDLFQKDLFKGK